MIPSHVLKIKKDIKFLYIFFIVISLSLVLEPYTLLGRGFKFKSGREKSIIPFNYIEGLIILPFKMENKRVNLILDTGISNIVLFDKMGKYGLKQNMEKDILFSGIGRSHIIKGKLIPEVKMETDDIEGSGLAVVIIPQKFLDKKLMNINGMIGYDLFSKFMVTIDYTKKQIILTYPKKVSPADYYEKELVFIGTKPHVNFYLSIPGIDEKGHLFFIDTGACFDLLLNHNPFSKNSKKDILGSGLTGNVKGKSYLIKDIYFENFYLYNLIISIPASGTYLDKNLMRTRDGTLGGKFLEKFKKVVIDYSNKKIYFQRDYLFAIE